MQLLYNNNIIDQIVTKLFRHRRNDYSQYHLENAIHRYEIKHQILPVCNRNAEKICTSLFYTKEIPTNCIIFLHGYGSNRLESVNILPFLTEDLALCSFDFSASGKSQGTMVTYGIKEKEDIHCTLNYLRRMGFKKFILWGRSMGATSSLLYSLAYQPQDVFLQIVDSPFYSFEMIAFQIASRNVKAPDFAISFALQMSRKNCEKFDFNPFDIVLSNVGECRTPALFVYCEDDNVINAQNTQLICDRYSATFEKLVIEENHNTIRSPETMSKIFTFVTKYLKGKKGHQPAKETTKDTTRETINEYFLDNKIKHFKSEKVLTNEGLSFQSSSEKARTLKKGINRVEPKELKRGQKYDDYGIWVASKFQNVSGHPEKQIEHMHSKNNRSSEASKRIHLSLSTSSVVNKTARSFDFSDSSIQPGRKDGSVVYGSEPSQDCLSRRGKLSTVRSIMTPRSPLNNLKYL